MLRFAQPLFLLLLPLLAAIWWQGFRRSDRRQAALAFPDLGLIRWSRAVRPVWESHLPWGLSALATILLCLALARPQAGFVHQVVNSSGVDIMICLDTSTSMQAMDLEPNRLQAAKAISEDFVRERTGDRIGLVVFAGAAFTQCPLTTDHGALIQLLRAANFWVTGTDGTAVGTAIATAANRLKDLPGKSKLIILMTDGRNNAGELDPQTAAKLAGEYGIKIYTIGIGTVGQNPLLTQDPLAMAMMQNMIPSDLDVESLTRIAQATGGRYFGAADNQSLARVYDEINRMEKVDTPTRTVTEYNELFPYPLALGLALLTLGAVLERTLLEEAP